MQPRGSGGKRGGGGGGGKGDESQRPTAEESAARLEADRQACIELMGWQGVDPALWAVGRTRLCLKAGVLKELEHRRHTAIATAANALTAHGRGMLGRREAQDRRAALRAQEEKAAAEAAEAAAAAAAAAAAEAQAAAAAAEAETAAAEAAAAEAKAAKVRKPSLNLSSALPSSQRGGGGGGAPSQRGSLSSRLFGRAASKSTAAPPASLLAAETDGPASSGVADLATATTSAAAAADHPASASSAPLAQGGAASAASATSVASAIDRGGTAWFVTAAGHVRQVRMLGEAAAFFAAGSDGAAAAATAGPGAFAVEYVKGASAPFPAAAARVFRWPPSPTELAELHVSAPLPPRPADAKPQELLDAEKLARSRARRLEKLKLLQEQLARNWTLWHPVCRPTAAQQLLVPPPGLEVLRARVHVCTCARCVCAAQRPCP